ncbi:hypothetical protein [Streptomyces sp. NPDC048385]|uniref:hypothetical protein n=1 Tax=unclassified Streptomyces TaxID=2593676 RepID=UPI00343E8A32
MHVFMAELLAGSTPLVMCLTVLMIALALLLLLIVRPVVKKTRPEDVPTTLFGLGYVMASLSAYLPWGKWRTFGSCGHRHGGHRHGPKFQCASCASDHLRRWTERAPPVPGFHERLIVRCNLGSVSGVMSEGAAYERGSVGRFG